MSRPHGLTLPAPLGVRKKRSLRALREVLLWYRHVSRGSGAWWEKVINGPASRRRLGENKSKRPKQCQRRVPGASEQHYLVHPGKEAGRCLGGGAVKECVFGVVAVRPGSDSRCRLRLVDGRAALARLPLPRRPWA